MGAVAKSYMTVTSSFIEHHTEHDFMLSPFSGFCRKRCSFGK
jgi:hypothetical protein